MAVLLLADGAGVGTTFRIVDAGKKIFDAALVLGCFGCFRHELYMLGNKGTLHAIRLYFEFSQTVCRSVERSKIRGRPGVGLQPHANDML